MTGINAEVNTGNFKLGGVVFSAGLGASYTPANNEFGFFGDISFQSAGLTDNNGGNFDTGGEFKFWSCSRFQSGKSRHTCRRDGRAGPPLTQTF